MCSYDESEIRDLEAWKRSSIGFAGPYGKKTTGRRYDNTCKLFPSRSM